MRVPESCGTRDRESTGPLDPELMLSPYKASEWQSLAPGERLVRAWALRARLVDPQDAHDSKLFPAP